MSPKAESYGVLNGEWKGQSLVQLSVNLREVMRGPRGDAAWPGSPIGIGLRFERLKRYHFAEPKLARLSSSRNHFLRTLSATTGSILCGTANFLPSVAACPWDMPDFFTKSSFLTKQYAFT